jgi:uncharacterized BrkB/YihY/UPF0761 family membrane protein
MSSAQLVPETWELTGDDARRALRDAGRRQLLKDAFIRMRVADGFSHARSLAFLISLVCVQGTIAVVGVASMLGRGWMSNVVVSAVNSAVPGPAGRTLTQAVQHARSVGDSHRTWALLFGLVGALVTGTTALGQIERGLNRIYGVEQDRPSVQKYGFAALLAVGVAIIGGLAVASLAFGHAIGEQLHNPALSIVWNVGRWPLGFALFVALGALLFGRCPRRRQPAWSWLAFGSSVSAVLCLAFTGLLATFFRISSSFGQTYGPLAGVVALLFWALLVSIAVFFGGATTAQLEAVRANAGKPQDQGKVRDSEPERVGEPLPVR